MLRGGRMERSGCGCLKSRREVRFRGSGAPPVPERHDIDSAVNDSDLSIKTYRGQCNPMDYVSLVSRLH
jgi:hypothetical protein